jgi:peptidoglycan hydrolase CwlO-like protein
VAGGNRRAKDADVKTLRVGIVTMAVLATMLTFETASATAQVQTSCTATQAHLSVLEARLAKLQQHIDARNAKIADAGHDLNKVNNWEAGLTHARQHHDRISERIAALTQRCQS